MKTPVSNIFLFILIATAFSYNKKNAAEPVHPPQQVNEWEFETVPVWTEEFSYSGKPDTTKWGYDIGGAGWGNNELQYYTNGKNAHVNNGILSIVARKENFNSNAYTSARMITKHKGDWLYGRFEIKAKLPKGKGTWPAIWMLPTDWEYGNWPTSGEIDIMEHVGFDQNRVHITVHTKAYNHTLGTQKGKNKVINTASDSFHVYRLDWASYGIRGYIDDEKIFEFMNNGNDFQAWPFDKRFHLLLNIAIGGNWGGQQGVDDTVFPAKMEVDYIKVYKFLK